MCISPEETRSAPSDELIRKFMRAFRSLNMALRPGHRSSNATAPPGHTPGTFKMKSHHRHDENHPRPKAFFVLHFLHHQHARGENLVRLSDVGADLQLAPPTVTLMLNDLEKDGFIERVRDREDRRVVRVRLTDEGAETLDSMYQNSKKQIEQLIDCLGLEDAERLLSLTQRAVACLQESRDVDA